MGFVHKGTGDLQLTNCPNTSEQKKKCISSFYRLMKKANVPTNVKNFIIKRGF